MPENSKIIILLVLKMCKMLTFIIKLYKLQCIIETQLFKTKLLEKLFRFVLKGKKNMNE